MVSKICYAGRGCATLWPLTLCHAAFRKYCTNLCQYERTAFSKALPGFGFAIRTYFYQLTGTAWCCAFTFLWLPGGRILSQGLFSICVASCVNNMFRFFLPWRQWKQYCPWIWFHSPEILDVHFFHPFYLPQMISSLSHLTQGSSAQPTQVPLINSAGFLVLCLLLAAHSNPLINFPEGSLIFKLPSSPMNSIPDLSNIPSNSSMLYRVLLEKNQGTIFMLAFLAISDLYCAFLLRQHLHSMISEHFTTLGSDSGKRGRTQVQIINGIMG